MEGEYESALAITLKKLRASDRFESEVRGWMSPYSPETATRVLEFLHTHRLINDRRVALAFATSRDGYGSERLRSDLERRGVEAAIIAEAMPSEEDERARVNQILGARYRPQDPPARAARFLIARGFPEDMVTSAVESYFGVDA